MGYMVVQTVVGLVGLLWERYATARSKGHTSKNIDLAYIVIFLRPSKKKSILYLNLKRFPPSFFPFVNQCS
jgi:hypothetical protein